jgi:hypothetical protein
MRNAWQPVRFLIGALLGWSAFGLGACTENLGSARVVPAAIKDVCDEAVEYARRTEQADGRVKVALQRIADTKSRECKARTSSGLGPDSPSTSARE